jgi:hypothetical protein
LGNPKARIWPLPPRTVHEDWIAWLPADKDELFSNVVEELEAVYSMLSISLNEALSFLRETSLDHARKQVEVCAHLFARLSGHLGSILITLEEHSRHFGTLPNAAPLNQQYFRGETAQRLAKRASLLGKVLLSSRSRYFHKLHVLSQAVAALEEEFRKVASEVSDGASVRPGAHWGELEVLHYDLNTCLRETIVLSKSFLCALPNSEVKTFRRKLETCRLLPRPEKLLAPLRPRRATLL